jgi:hypothetical protein
MAYFSELPNLQYTANFPDQSFNTDVVLAKNIFKRAKLRDDFANVVTAFTYYQIIDNERPDQIAQKVYNDPELDWVILTTNNITNFSNQWPLDNESFHKYLLDKYGSEEEIQAIHHYESVEYRDEYNRLVSPGGLIVDPPYQTQGNVVTNSSSSTYSIPSFPVKGQTQVSVDLNQFLTVYGNNENTSVPITDIQTQTSNLGISGRDGDIPITITNDLNVWPSSWGGSVSLYGRDTNTNLSISDQLGSQNITIPNTLYRITSPNGVNAFITLIYSTYTNTAFPGITIRYQSNTQYSSFTNTLGSSLVLSEIAEVTNYDYEVKLNEEKRKILILKAQYLSVFINDMKNIMKYDQSSDYIDATTKATYNPNLTGN